MEQEQGGRHKINVEGLFTDMFRPQKLTSFKELNASKVRRCSMPILCHVYGNGLSLQIVSSRDCRVALEVMKLISFQKFVVPVMEPVIRRVVKEELELALQKRNHIVIQSNSDDEAMQPADPRRLQLKFSHSVSQPLFSEAPVKAEGDTKMELALIDASTGDIVRNEPISSARVELVVLDGEFDDDDVGDNWTGEKFNSKILRAREGKKDLLTGNVVFNLKQGVGLPGDIIITDNSSWRRNRKFRLGARVLDHTNEIRVREAKTGPFVVKDHRSEGNKKSDCPSLSDEVWRLKKIGKKGPYHRRMTENGIFTVKEFLILLYQDPAQLRNILGKMDKTMWEAIVNHAKTCALDKSAYMYQSVVFNVVGQIMGLFRDGQYFLVEKLSEAEKADARNLVTLAFKHWEDVITLDDEISLQVQSSPLGHFNYPSNSAMPGSSNGVNALTSDNGGNFDYPELYASTTDVMSPIFANVNHPSRSSPIAGISDRTNIQTSDNDGNFDDQELYASITDAMSPIRNNNNMDEFGLRYMEIDEDNHFF